MKHADYTNDPLNGMGYRFVDFHYESYDPDADTHVLVWMKCPKERCCEIQKAFADKVSNLVYRHYSIEDTLKEILEPTEIEWGFLPCDTVNF